MRHVQGPDFPTGGLIVGRQGIVDAYRTGRGRVVVRGRAHNEQLRNGRNAIVFTELPYQVNKSDLVRRIAELAEEKVVPEVSDVNDESGRDGTRVVVVLRRGAVPLVVLNKLFKHTSAQSTFGVNAIALVDGVPRTLGLREILGHYLEHQRQVVVRRSRFRLARAEARAHILEGLLIALGNIDEVIALIRAAADPDEARSGLMSRFSLTEVQARAILDLRLQRLTQLEGTTIRNEHEQLQTEIAGLRAILGDEARVMAVIREEILALRERFADERRSEIIPGEGEIDLEDLIAEEEMVVSISRGGYIKRLPVSTYRAQRRGGKGLRGARLKDDDYIEHLFIASTHAYLLFFTNRGRVYRQKVYELPQGARDARGRHISNVLALVDGEEVRAVFATRDYNEAKYLVLATRDGMVKKTELKAYDTVLREAGLFAINLTDDDELVGVQMTDGDDDILIVSARGQAARFAEAAVRPMGRQTRGVKAMNLDAGRPGPGAVRCPRRRGSAGRDGQRLRQADADVRLSAQGPADQGRADHQGHRSQGRAGDRTAGARGPPAAAGVAGRAGHSDRRRVGAPDGPLDRGRAPHGDERRRPGRDGRGRTRPRRRRRRRAAPSRPSRRPMPPTRTPDPAAELD